VSNYSTGDLLESQDSSTDSGSEIESESDDRPVQKKQKKDNTQHSKKGESPGISTMNKQT
jgi:hypothetical protein